MAVEFAKFQSCLSPGTILATFWKRAEQFFFKKTRPFSQNGTKHNSFTQIYFAWPYMNCSDKSLPFPSTFVILKCRCIRVIFLLCFISLRTAASKTECQHAVDLWLNSWRDTEELPCQSPQGLERPSVPRQGSLGSKKALNLVILEANGRYQRLQHQSGWYLKEGCLLKQNARLKETKFIINQREGRWKKFSDCP